MCPQGFTCPNKRRKKENAQEQKCRHGGEVITLDLNIQFKAKVLRPLKKIQSIDWCERTPTILRTVLGIRGDKMKNQIISALLALGTTLSGLAYADAAPSVDRTVMDQVMLRAKQEKKSVILEVSAAWCGPCQEFAHEMDTHPENLKDLSDRGFIFVKTESEKIMNGELLNVNDYLPAYIHFFPVFYMYSANLGWKTLATASSYATLIAAIDTVRSHPTPLTPAEIKKMVEAQDAGQQQSPDSTRLLLALYDLSTSYNYNDAKTIFGLLQASKSYSDAADSLKSMFLVDFLVQGISYATLAHDFPETATNWTDVSQDDFTIKPFGRLVTAVFKKSGLNAAAQQCGTIWQQTRARLVKGTLSREDFQEKIAGYDLSATVLCADLELRVTGPTDSLKQKVAKLDATKIKDWYLIAGLGEKDQAVAIYHKKYSKFVDDYAEGLKSLQANLEKAMQDKNQKLVDEINASIETAKFRSEYHATVDRDVEQALKNGQALQALSVVN
jgi:hypothetical protein